MGVKRFEVAGVFYHKNAVRSAANKRNDFSLSDEDFRSSHSDGKRVFQYYFSRNSKVDLVEEPENLHDQNAIAVYVNGEKIGYVPANLAPELHSILKQEYSVSAFLKGGPRRWVEGNEVLTDSSDMEVELTVDSSAIADSAITGRRMHRKKHRFVVLILCIFFGYFGIHYFYLGKVGKGLLYLFTVGLFFIGWIYDIFRITTHRFKI